MLASLIIAIVHEPHSMQAEVAWFAFNVSLTVNRLACRYVLVSVMLNHQTVRWIGCIEAVAVGKPPQCLIIFI